MTLSTTTEERFIVGLEIGSSRAKIGVAGFDPSENNGELTVYSADSLSTVDSVRYGRITNIRDVEDIINRLVKSVESSYPIQGRRVLGVYVNIGGRTLRSHKISARTVFADRREITADMLNDLRDEALATLPSDVEIVDTMPLQFTVDNIPTPRPIGSLGSRLAGDFTAVVCSHSNKDDLSNVVIERAGLSICGWGVLPVAVANLVLSKAETNAGCMLVDIGAETITVAIYRSCALHYLTTIPIGSRLITRDLAASMALTEADAEEIKINMGDAMPETTDDRQRKNINTIITARLADLVANIVAQPGFADLQIDQLRGGIVLTGGGSKLRNLGRLLENYTHLKVRIATLPSNISIADSSLSATDNLDLIALLNDAVNDARLNPDSVCLSQRQDKSQNVVIDLSSSESESSDKIVQPSSYGYEPNDFVTPNDYDPSDGYDDDTDVDDDDDVLVDDDVDKTHLYHRHDEPKRQKTKKTKKTKPFNSSKPSLADRIISRITNLVSGDAEDNSPDMD